MIGIQQTIGAAETRISKSSENDYFIADCSFGKDSMAMLKICIDRGYPIDEVNYVHMMYSDDWSAEYPIHMRWIEDVGIPYVTEILGLKFKSLESPTYKTIVTKIVSKGLRKGDHFGFPQRKCPRCNSVMKVAAINRHNTELKKLGYVVRHFVGIAADEKKRVARGIRSGYIMPLAIEGITERDAFKICRKERILSPIYENAIFNRIGCWFCPHSTIEQLKYVWQTSPELFEDLVKLDKCSKFKFHPPYTATDLWNMFESESAEQKTLIEVLGVKV